MPASRVHGIWQPGSALFTVAAAFLYAATAADGTSKLPSSLIFQRSVPLALSLLFASRSGRSTVSGATFCTSTTCGSAPVTAASGADASTSSEANASPADPMPAVSRTAETPDTSHAVRDVPLPSKTCFSQRPGCEGFLPEAEAQV